MARRARVVQSVVGIAVLAALGGVAAANGYFRGPAPAAVPDDVSLEVMCDWRGAMVELFSQTPLTARKAELAVFEGAESTFRLELTNRLSRELELPEGSAPVLIAAAPDGSVQGVASAGGHQTATSLGVGEVAEFKDFGAFLACPGAATAPDGRHLAAGSYGLHAAQALGWLARSEGSPFTTWTSLGSLQVSPPLYPTPSATPTTEDEDVEPVPDLEPGTCGSESYLLTSDGEEDLRFDAPGPVLALVGEPFDPAVTMTHRGSLPIADAVQGGPIIFVADEDGKIVARSRSIDPLPGPGVEPGEQISFGRFEALVHCQTGEPLQPGSYRWTVEQTATGTGELSGIASSAGDLVVTDDPEARRPSVRAPVLPRCGESVEGFELPEELLRAKLVRAGRMGWSADGSRRVLDPEGGWPTVEIEAVYPGPDRSLVPQGSELVLAKGGEVVAHARSVDDISFDVELPVAAGEVLEVTLEAFWQCPEDSHESFEPDGEYTLIGFSTFASADEWGLPDYYYVAAGPVVVDFGPRASDQ